MWTIVYRECVLHSDQPRRKYMKYIHKYKYKYIQMCLKGNVFCTQTKSNGIQNICIVLSTVFDALFCYSNTALLYEDQVKNVLFRRWHCCGEARRRSRSSSKCCGQTPGPVVGGVQVLWSDSGREKALWVENQLSVLNWIVLNFASY